MVISDYESAKNYASGIIKELPNADWESIREAQFLSTKYKIPYINVVPKNISESYLNSLGNKLFHFCSVEKGISILNGGELWFNQIESIKDNEEFKNVLIDISKLNSYGIDMTRNSRTLWNYVSMTTSNNLFNEQMWQIHGDEGRGVVIEFEIGDFDSLIVPRIFIQQVNYSYRIIDAFLQRHDMFMREFPYNFVVNWGCYPAFFKRDEFSFEQEIRIIIESSLDQHPNTVNGIKIKRFTPFKLGFFLKPVKVYCWNKKVCNFISKKLSNKILLNALNK